MPAYAPKFTDTLRVKLGSVDNSAVLLSGSANLAANLSFSASDVGAQVLVFSGSGVKVITAVHSVSDSGHAVLNDTAPGDINPGTAIIFRPYKCRTDAPININNSLGLKDTAGFTIQSLDGSFRPVRGTNVLIIDDVLGPLFGGIVDSVKFVNAPGSPAVWSECQCIGFDYLLYKRTAGELTGTGTPPNPNGGTFTGFVAGDIVSYLVDHAAGGDGLSNSVIAGPTVDSVAFDYSFTAGSAIDALLSLINTGADIYYSFVDPWRTVVFAKRSTAAAPWNISTGDGSDSNVLIQVANTTDGAKLQNRCYINEGMYIADAVEEDFTGDGTRRTWDVTDNPIASEPSITLDLGAGPVTQSVGIDGQDTGKNYYWQVNSKTIRQDASATILVFGNTLAVTYQGFVSKVIGPSISSLQNSASVNARAAIEGGTGYYDTYITVSTPSTLAGGTSLGSSLVSSFGDVPSKVEVQSYRGGLRPGQSITVNLPEVGASGTYIVFSVTLDCSGNLMLWTYELYAGALIGDWRQAFKNLAGGNQSVSGSVGSGAGTGPAGPPGPAGGTAPPAPNIPSATATVRYGLYGNASAYGFSGSIDLPTTDANYAHLKKVHVLWYRGTEVLEIATLYAPWASTPQAWDSGHDLQYLQDGSYHTDSIAFLCENDDGTISASPLTKSVTVQASAVVAGFAASDSGTRTTDPATRIVSALINFTPQTVDAIYPQTVASWMPSAKDVTKYTAVGWTQMASATQVISTPRLVPNVAATWHVYSAAGPVQSDPNREYTAAELTSMGAVASVGFAMAGIPAPAASDGITATIGTCTTVFDLSKKPSGEIPPIEWTDPTSGRDFWTRWTVQDYSAAGVPLSEEKVHGGSQITAPGDPHVNGNPLLVTYYAGLGFIRYRGYVANRLSQGTGDYLNTATNTLQLVAYNGAAPADHCDVTVPIDFNGAPDVLRFDAGSALIDGSFDATIGWDDNRENVLVDFACLAPSDQTNWGYFAIYLGVPNGALWVWAIATQFFTDTDFTPAAEGLKVCRGQIRIARDRVPAVRQFWRFVACPSQRDGTHNQYPDGSPKGPMVQLLTPELESQAVKAGKLDLRQHNPAYVDGTDFDIDPATGRFRIKNIDWSKSLPNSLPPEFTFDGTGKVVMAGVDLSKAWNYDTDSFEFAINAGGQRYLKFKGIDLSKAFNFDSNEFSTATGKLVIANASNWFNFDTTNFRFDQVKGLQIVGVDLTKAIGNTFSQEEFSVTDNVFVMKNIKADKIKTGILSVGGYGVSQFSVWDQTGTVKLGFIGDDRAVSGYVGAFFTQLILGSYNNLGAIVPEFYCNAGNIVAHSILLGNTNIETDGSIGGLYGWIGSKVSPNVQGTPTLWGGAWFKRCAIGGTAVYNAGFFVDSNANVVAKSILLMDNGAMGWIGSRGGVQGAWFPRVWIGGTGPDSSAPMYADNTGNLVLNSLTVYNPTNTLLNGWIGSKNGYYGAWFPRVWIGGTDPSSAALFVDNAGHLVSNGAIISRLTIQAPNIQAGLFTGCEMELNPLGTNVRIAIRSNFYDPVYGVWTGFRVNNLGDYRSANVSYAGFFTTSKSLKATAELSGGDWGFLSLRDEYGYEKIRMCGGNNPSNGGMVAGGIKAAAYYDTNQQQVLKNRQAMISFPAGGTVVDVDARRAITDLINRLSASQGHGLIAN